MKENQARLKNAEGDLVRYTKLEAQGLITGQQVTTQEALVQQYQGALQANEAQVNNARLQLSYTESSRPSMAAWACGRSTPATWCTPTTPTASSSSPRCVPFRSSSPCPKPICRRCWRAAEDRRMPVEAWDRTDTTKIANGVLQTVDNQIDTATGTIKLRAQFENADDQLFPNQFVNIRLRVRRLPDATVIPSAAVQRASFGTFVYVVKDIAR